MITPQGIKDRGGARPITIMRSRLARALALAVALATMSLGMTALAEQSGHRPTAQELFRHGERASQDRTGTATAQELFRDGERASQDQTTTGTPVKVTAPARLAESSRPPGWLVPALGVLAAALALFGGLTLLTARRTRVKMRSHQAA